MASPSGTWFPLHAAYRTHAAYTARPLPCPPLSSPAQVRELQASPSELTHLHSQSSPQHSAQPLQLQGLLHAGSVEKQHSLPGSADAALAVAGLARNSGGGVGGGGGSAPPSTLRGRALLRMGMWTWALNDVRARGSADWAWHGRAGLRAGQGSLASGPGGVARA